MNLRRAFLSSLQELLHFWPVRRDGMTGTGARRGVRGRGARGEEEEEGRGGRRGSEASREEKGEDFIIGSYVGNISNVRYYLTQGSI